MEIEHARNALLFEAEYGVMPGPKITTLIDLIALYQRNGYVMQAQKEGLTISRVKSDPNGKMLCCNIADYIYASQSFRKYFSMDALHYVDGGNIADAWDVVVRRGFALYECKRRDATKMIGFELDYKTVLKTHEEIEKLGRESADPVYIYVRAIDNNLRYISLLAGNGFTLDRKYHISWKMAEWESLKLSTDYSIRDIDIDSRAICVARKINPSSSSKNNVIQITNQQFKYESKDDPHTQMVKFFASYRDVPDPWRPGDPI